MTEHGTSNPGLEGPSSMSQRPPPRSPCSSRTCSLAGLKHHTPTSHPRAFAQALPAVWNPCTQMGGCFSLWELSASISSSEGLKCPSRKKKKGFVFLAARVTEGTVMTACLPSPLPPRM